MNRERELVNILKFFHEAEKIKSILRHSWLASGRRESVAEHMWRMALMAVVLRGQLQPENRPDMEKTLKMVIIHDLCEIYAGDRPAFKKDKTNKHLEEKRSLAKVLRNVNPKTKNELMGLWMEYGERKSKESKFVKALDRLEVELQHYEADIKHLTKAEFKFNLTHGFKECEYDKFLMTLRQAINRDIIKLYKKHKINKKLYT